MEESQFIAYYIMNKEAVWNMVADMKDKKERFEMIQKLINIEMNLGNMNEDGRVNVSLQRLHF